MKIGVFDSGLGGLTILKELTTTINGASFFYLADTFNAPYGEKTPEQILRYSLKITQFFINNHQIDALIVACNTATSASIEQIRINYPNLIVIGTEPGIKPAIEMTTTGRVGVLATPATLKGKKYQKLASKLASQKNIILFEQSCPGLVEQIEKAEIDTEKTKKMLHNWLAPMRDGGVDTIVLGCTHYPLVSNMIEHIMQRELNLVHTGDAIAKRLLDLSKSIAHINSGAVDVTLYSTSKINKKIINNILKDKKVLPVALVKL